MADVTLQPSEVALFVKSRGPSARLAAVNSGLLPFLLVCC